MPNPTSNEDTVLGAALAVLQGLTWALDQNGNAVLLTANVRRRMLPLVSETLDAVPCVLLAAGAAEDEGGFSFEGEKDVVYAVEVAIVATNNDDFTTSEPLYIAWREQVKRAFGTATLAGAPTVWDTRLSLEPLFDRGLLNQQYAYQSITVRFTSHESRT
jgi:hypothetical protein